MANQWHIERTITEVERISFRGLRRFAKILKQEVEQGAPGSLKNSVSVKPRFFKKSVLVTSSHKSGEPVAAWVEFGTAPHIITPKTKKVLRWFDGDTAIFAKKVRHPGTKPNPYFRRGITRAIARVREAFR